MGDSQTKNFTITGDAAAAMGGTRKRKRRTTAPETLKVGKEVQKGGTSPGTTLQIESNKVTSLVDPPPTNFQKSTDVALAKTTTESNPAPVQSAGAKPVKVILEKKKKATRVVLAPTKVRKLNPTAPATPAKTRKVAKKIRMSLNGFGTVSYTHLTLPTKA